MNHPWFKKEIKKYQDVPEFNKNECTTYTKLWNLMRTVLRGKFIALSVFLKKVEKSHTSNLSAQVKHLEQNKLTHPGDVNDRK